MEVAATCVVVSRLWYMHAWTPAHAHKQKLIHTHTPKHIHKPPKTHTYTNIHPHTLGMCERVCLQKAAGRFLFCFIWRMV